MVGGSERQNIRQASVAYADADVHAYARTLSRLRLSLGRIVAVRDGLRRATGRRRRSVRRDAPGADWIRGSRREMTDDGIRDGIHDTWDDAGNRSRRRSTYAVALPITNTTERAETRAETARVTDTNTTQIDREQRPSRRTWRRAGVEMGKLPNCINDHTHSCSHAGERLSIVR